MGQINEILTIFLDHKILNFSHWILIGNFPEKFQTWFKPTTKLQEFKNYKNFKKKKIDTESPHLPISNNVM
jgi:hypothetical protein